MQYASINDILNPNKNRINLDEIIAKELENSKPLSAEGEKIHSIAYKAINNVLPNQIDKKRIIVREDFNPHSWYVGHVRKDKTGSLIMLDLNFYEYSSLKIKQNQNFNKNINSFASGVFYAIVHEYGHILDNEKDLTQPVFPYCSYNITIRPMKDKSALSEGFAYWFSENITKFNNKLEDVLYVYNHTNVKLLREFYNNLSNENKPIQEVIRNISEIIIKSEEALKSKKFKTSTL